MGNAFERTRLAARLSLLDMATLFEISKSTAQRWAAGEGRYAGPLMIFIRALDVALRADPRLRTTIRAALARGSDVAIFSLWAQVFSVAVAAAQKAKDA